MLFYSPSGSCATREERLVRGSAPALGCWVCPGGQPHGWDDGTSWPCHIPMLLLLPSGLSQGKIWERGWVQAMGTEDNWFLSWLIDQWRSDWPPGELVAALHLPWSPGPGTVQMLEGSQWLLSGVVISQLGCEPAGCSCVQESSG